MTLEVPLTLVPMEALPVNDLPSGAGWLFEPKYDGFRCLLFRDGDTIHLQSRRQRPLGRYFPEVIDAARDLPVERFVFDGELIIPDQPFDALQLRLHPAASRVQKLSREHPAQMVVFDLLANEQGQSLLGQTVQRATCRSGGRFQADRQGIQFCAVQGDDISRHCKEMAEATLATVSMASWRSVWNCRTAPASA